MFTAHLTQSLVYGKAMGTRFLPIQVISPRQVASACVARARAHLALLCCTGADEAATAEPIFGLRARLH